jgi:hypothetical protein
VGGVKKKKAKHKRAILGGIGISIGCSFAGRAIIRALIKFGNTDTNINRPSSTLNWVLRVKGVVSVLQAFGRMLGGGSWGGWMRKVDRCMGCWGCWG